MDWQKLDQEVSRLHGKRLEYKDNFDPDLLAGNPDLKIQKAGGGYLVLPRRAEVIEEVHVILHGSVRLPVETHWAVGPCSPEDAASTLVDNCDLGTSALGMELAHWIARDPSSNRSLAFFDVTRVLIDANRYRIEDQMPKRPYRGAPVLRSDLSTSQKRSLLKQWLSPWVDLASAAITGNGVLRVFHHHTYDPVGQVGQPLDRSFGMPRPAGMVFLKSPHETVGSPTATASTLVEPKFLKRVVARLQEHLRQIQPEAEVLVDWPYVCPLMPLLPEVLARQHPPGPSPRMATIIYEVRKDLLRREEGLYAVVKAIQEISDDAQAFQSA